MINLRFTQVSVIAALVIVLVFPDVSHAIINIIVDTFKAIVSIFAIATLINLSKIGIYKLIEYRKGKKK